jgi:Ca2+-binding EF-hand superfamily protein
MKRTVVVACGLAFVALPAGLAGPDADKHFKMMDTNGDGLITRAEHVAGAKKIFTELDANKDGIVTAAEMEAASIARGEKTTKNDKAIAEKIREIDLNSDGRLTPAEHAAGSEKMFAKADTNGDGALSKQECDEAMKKVQKDY